MEKQKKRKGMRKMLGWKIGSDNKGGMYQEQQPMAVDGGLFDYINGSEN